MQELTWVFAIPNRKCTTIKLQSQITWEYRSPSKWWHPELHHYFGEAYTSLDRSRHSSTIGMNRFLQSDGLCIKTTRVLHVLPFCWWHVCILEATRNILVLSFLSGLWHLYPAVQPYLLLKDFSSILQYTSLYLAIFFLAKVLYPGI